MLLIFLLIYISMEICILSIDAYWEIYAFQKRLKIRKSKNDRQYNAWSKEKKGKKIDYDPQNTTQKNKLMLM